VHDEAERLEHVLSEELEERIDKVLGFPTHDPHGDPIPDANLRWPQPAAAAAGSGHRAKRRSTS
jgi:DtxR family transcriptional regulator, Mn-dependent transcriptional regulator